MKIAYSTLLCIGFTLFVGCEKELPQEPEPIHGCTDPIATNYNQSAEIDDGSCQY